MYINLAVDTKKKKSITSQLKKSIDDRSKMMKAQGITTLHFPIDLSTATSPEGVDYTKYEPKAPAPAPKPVDRTRKFEGSYVTTKGETLNGTYVFRSGASENPRFYQDGNVKFIYDNKGKQNELNISPSKFKGGSFNGRTFTIIKRRAGISIKKSVFAAEIIQTGSKMTLLKAYPLEKKKDGSIMESQTLIKVEGEDGFSNVGDIANPKFINWKKGFAKLFEDCEVLYAEIRVGEFTRDIASISEAIRLYNKNSCK